jgi:hypothetical protein
MPTFTDASLIAAGTGPLLWAVLADEASSRRRTWIGLAGFAAIVAAVFVRYTDVVMLGCAVLAVIVAWRMRQVPGAALSWWLGSVVVLAAGVGVFDDLAYGGPLKSGYPPGDVVFNVSAVLTNFRDMPKHLIEAVPMLVLGLAALIGIVWRRLRLRRAGDEQAAVARRDLAVGLALAASWFSVWGLYAAYTWTTQSGLSSLQVVRFYAPALGAIALLGAWLLVRVPRKASLAAVTTAAVVAAMFVLGLWSYNTMRQFRLPGPPPRPAQPSAAQRRAGGPGGPSANRPGSGS